MAVTVSRRAGSGSANFTQGLQRADSITYTVVGYDVRELKRLMSSGTRPLDLEQIPNYNQPHPENAASGMVARTFSITESETGYACDVVVGFSTSNVTGTGTLFAVPDLTDAKFVWELTFEDVEVEIPVAFRIIGKVSDGTAEGKQVKHWEIRPQPVMESRVVVMARWQIGPHSIPAAVFTPAMRVAFENEHNKVHTIGAYRYLFRVNSISARDGDTYEISASWSRDDGTPQPTKGSADLAFTRLPHELGYWKPIENDPGNIWPNQPNTLIRSPFHHLETIPGLSPGDEDDDLSAPFCVQLQDYELGDFNNLPEVRF